MVSELIDCVSVRIKKIQPNVAYTLNDLTTIATSFTMSVAESWQTSELVPMSERLTQSLLCFVPQIPLSPNVRYGAEHDPHRAFAQSLARKVNVCFHFRCSTGFRLCFSILSFTGGERRDAPCFARRTAEISARQALARLRRLPISSAEQNRSTRVRSAKTHRMCTSVGA
jgi:hypothetical protein